MSELAKTPAPPYYVAIFSSRRSADDGAGYNNMAERMVQIASRQPGFLGIESVRQSDGLGITVSYWETAEAIRHWHEHAQHRLAQELGYARWYDSFELRIARVERAYGFDRNQPGDKRH